MYKRILLKLSGEALETADSAFNPVLLNELAQTLKEVTEKGVQVAIVVGGGNIIRGKFASQLSLPRVNADNMGMLATIINALALQGAFEANGLKSTVRTAVEVNKVAEIADARKAVAHLNDGEILIYGGGTGNPYFSTDSAAALRASEINADVILMAKNGVDGVYNADPRVDKNAVMYDTLTYDEILNKKLGVMDLTAASLCRDNNIETRVFNMNNLQNIIKVIDGEKIGTVIKGGI